MKEKTGSESVEAYRVSVKERLEKANAQRAEREIEDKIIKTITDASEVEIPDALVEREIDNMVQQVSYRLMYQGLKFEDYLKYTGSKLEDMLESYKPQAEKNVKLDLGIKKVAELEKIVADAEEKIASGEYVKINGLEEIVKNFKPVDNGK